MEFRDFKLGASGWRDGAGVHCLAVDSNGTNIYVGGNFVGGLGVSSPNFIKWDAVNGHWAAMGSGLTLGCFDDIDCNGNYFLNCDRDSWVTQIVAPNGYVYVAGTFSSGGGIARFTTSGTQLSWGTIADSGTASPEGNGVAYLHGVVYVSGLFDSVNGVTAKGIADCECFAVLLLNTRRRVKGHQLISIGTLDTILVHPREVFRGALIAAAAAIVIMHNHPSGEPTPSEADIKVTRDLIRAGQLLKIEVLDHVIIGRPNHCSLRELGYFAGF